MKWPISKVYITQEFGENPHIYQQFGMAGHNGVDFRTRFVDSMSGKRPVYAALDGTVTVVEDQGRKGYGKYIRMKHNGTSQTVYGHMSSFLVLKGTRVMAGGKIGISGNTGFSTGPHLHFGYRPDKWEKNYNNGFYGYIDPLPYLRGSKEVKKEVVDPAFAKKWAGWLIIVPELGGEVWYVNPTTLKRYKLNNFSSDVAALLARDGAWVGMTYADLTKIPEA